MTFYLANHLFMNWMPYSVRIPFLRKACGLRIGRDTSIAMGCFVTGRDISIGDNTAINGLIIENCKVALNATHNRRYFEFVFVE